VLTKLLAFAPVAAVGILLLAASGTTRAQPVPVVLGEYLDYYNYDLDNLYDIDPRNYGYPPRSYEEPWLYRPPYFLSKPPTTYGYENLIFTPVPPRAGFYPDGYEDDDWYYDYYHHGGESITGVGTPGNNSLENTKKSKIQWYDW
jgi:hypothetical protein